MECPGIAAQHGSHIFIIDSRNAYCISVGWVASMARKVSTVIFISASCYALDRGNKRLYQWQAVGSNATSDQVHEGRCSQVVRQLLCACSITQLWLHSTLLQWTVGVWILNFESVSLHNFHQWSTYASTFCYLRSENLCPCVWTGLISANHHVQNFSCD